MEIVTSWSEQTIFDLASIKKDARIGIVYRSPRTIGLIQSALDNFNIKYESLAAFNEKNLRTFKDFCEDKTVLIAEPLSLIFRKDRQEEYLKHFFEKGGKIINFDHYIDKGSMMIIEQAVLRIIEKKKSEETVDILDI